MNIDWMWVICFVLCFDLLYFKLMLFETHIKKIVEFISVNGVKRAVSRN